MSTHHKSSHLFALLAAGQLLFNDPHAPPVWDAEHNKPRAAPPRPVRLSDIQPEYDLIVQKKSKLSSSQRAQIVRWYEHLEQKEKQA